MLFYIQYSAFSCITPYMRAWYKLCKIYPTTSSPASAPTSATSTRAVTTTTTVVKIHRISRNLHVDVGYCYLPRNLLPSVGARVLRVLLQLLCGLDNYRGGDRSDQYQRDEDDHRPDTY